MKLRNLISNLEDKQKCYFKWLDCPLRRLKTYLDKRFEKVSFEQSLLKEKDKIFAVNREDKAKVYKAAQEVFTKNPKFSIKTHIYTIFLFSLIISIGIGMALLFTVYRMEKNSDFDETLNMYYFNIQQARLYEKDYFLYGTNLDKALESIESAKLLILKSYDNLKRIVGTDLIISKFSSLEGYEDMLKNLYELELSPSIPRTEHLKKKEKIKDDLYKFEQNLVSFSRELLQKERESKDKMMLLFKIVHIYAIVALFIYILLIIHLLYRRVLRHIKRFTEHTRHIASGNYIPILPIRHYRDEFSELYLAINQMMEELERQQETLSQTHKLRAVGTLTAGIAHELNNPLNNISITAHMLLEDYNDLPDDERIEMVNDLINETARSQKIVRNLLDFARESESTMEPICIGSLIQETIDIVGNQIDLAGVHVDVNVEPNLSRIHIDKQQVIQVLLNLIINALDVTRKGGIIKISATPSIESNFVSIRVTDFGPGIPDHILNQIFDPFFTTKEKGKGTGLGLAVSQGIVAKHGGQMHVTTKIKKGTTFTIKLPITTLPADIGAPCEPYYSSNKNNSMV